MDNFIIENEDSEDWQQIKCKYVPKPELGTYSEAYSEAYP